MMKHRQIHHKSKNARWIGEGEWATTVVRRNKKFLLHFALNETVMFSWWRQDERSQLRDWKLSEVCCQGNMETRGMRLVEENARSNIHSDVVNHIGEEGLNIMAHPAYSPDHFTVWLLGQWFDEINEKCFDIQGVEKYCRRRIFEKLFERMEVCRNNHDEYFEHLIK